MLEIKEIIFCNREIYEQPDYIESLIIIRRCIVVEFAWQQCLIKTVVVFVYQYLKLTLKVFLNFFVSC